MTLCLRAFAAALTLCVTTGCATEAHIEQIVLRAFPEGTVIEIQQSCTSIMGPAVALFSVTNHRQESLIDNQVVDGVWTRAEALGEFADLMDTGKPGPGVSMTILDGKKCFRKMKENANETLFGQNRGQYFTSVNREVVIILPEATPGEGILFVQAP